MVRLIAALIIDPVLRFGAADATEGPFWTPIDMRPPLESRVLRGANLQDSRP